MWLFQERQRLETILSLCSELGRAERDGGGPAPNSTSAVADLQKINQELEKLQVNDDDDDTPSVFSDSSAVNGIPGSGHMTSPGSENGYFDDDLQMRRRCSSGHRDYRAESPAVSLRSFAPSPSSRSLRTNEVSIKYFIQTVSWLGVFEIILCQYLYVVYLSNPEFLQYNSLLSYSLTKIWVKQQNTFTINPDIKSLPSVVVKSCVYGVHCAWISFIHLDYY